jgi:cell wall assembly regulator SMI1
MSSGNRKKASEKEIRAMLAAAEAGDLQKVKQLLRAGINPDVSLDDNSDPALIVAANCGHEEIFLELVKAGADLHATYGTRSVLCSLMGENITVPMIRALIDSGIRPGDQMGRALCYACAWSGLDVLRTLIRSGADVNAKSNEGASPLIWAVYYNRPAIVDELLKAGANPNVRVPHGIVFRTKHYKMTALQVARAKRSAKIGRLLEDAGARPPPTPRRSAKPGTVGDSWKRIGRWALQHAPRWKPLKKGARPSEIASAEKELGFPLPAELRESYQLHNGSGSAGVFPCSFDISFCLMPLSEAVTSWKTMKELDDLGEFRARPARRKNEKGIRSDWWNVRWVPFAGNGAGDYFCIDLAPAAGGHAGQVITMSHEAIPIGFWRRRCGII